MNDGVLAFAYFMALVYLFLGISIISDIFMGSIEVITSQTKEIEYVDENGTKQKAQVSVWNPTIANLTLMALGSSAPEILLSIIETISTLGSTPGELGPSTIVGSAAFNLMVISAVSIYAVETGSVKKIDDLGVFAITSISSLFAYVWLYTCLQLWTKEVISIAEAILTLCFFFILIILAFCADKYNERKKKRQAEKEGKVEGAEDLLKGGQFMHILNVVA